jgi:hypothetical protein
MQPLMEELLAHCPVLTDGAGGREFERLGLPPGECPGPMEESETRLCV